MVEDTRIQTTTTILQVRGIPVEHHYYTRFYGRHTDLYFFGSGLGDQAMFQQIGDSFLTILDEDGDPRLGRVVFSMGRGPTAFAPFKGDFNLCWGYAITRERFAEYVRSMTVRPDVVLNPWDEILEEAERQGFRTYRFSSGVGRFFKPLGLKREGYGYAGLDTKEDWIKDIVLGPVLDSKRFEWISKTPKSKFLTLPSLNQWYNTKQITFGMVEESRIEKSYIPSRVYETLASGTPLILYRIPGFEKVMGFSYPYQTTSREETEFHIGQIMGNYWRVLEKVAGYSHYIREHHSYRDKLLGLFEYLKELKK